MSNDTTGRPEGWDAREPDEPGGQTPAQPGTGGLEDDAVETEAARIRSDQIVEPEGVARDAGARRFRNEAERIRSDQVDEPAGTGVAGGGDLGAMDETEAVRIRSDAIEEPDDVARDPEGRRRFKDEAQRIRSDGIVEPPD